MNEISSIARTTGSDIAIAGPSSALEQADKEITAAKAANAAANFLNFIFSSFVDT
jgi:thymidine phosphorylase